MSTRQRSSVCNELLPWYGQVVEGLEPDRAALPRSRPRLSPWKERSSSMLAFLSRRLLTVFLPTLLGISVLIFGAMRLVPGSFVDVMIGVGPDVSTEQRDAIAASYGLDQPLPLQYL